MSAESSGDKSNAADLNGDVKLGKNRENVDNHQEKRMGSFGDVPRSRSYFGVTPVEAPLKMFKERYRENGSGTASSWSIVPGKVSLVEIMTMGIRRRIPESNGLRRTEERGIQTQLT